MTSSCTTDSNGSCKFEVSKDDLRNPSYALYAERTGEDGQPELAYLTFSDLQIQLGIYDAEGASGSDQTHKARVIIAMKHIAEGETAKDELRDPMDS